MRTNIVESFFFKFQNHGIQHPHTRKTEPNSKKKNGLSPPFSRHFIYGDFSENSKVLIDLLFFARLQTDGSQSVF